MPNLVLKNVNKIYSGGIQAIYDFNLEVADHEFVVLVGPSGCGKSTVLRMIAGLEEITSGEVILDGKIINNKAPSDRNISMIFQNYALYSHMSVYENVGFSMIVRKESKEKVYNAVMKAQSIVNLTNDQLKRKPNQLSGGQKQRVAVARAITKDTKLCLMDEPLSNLDAKLRSSMRSEITKLYNELGQTIIYVTHDQIEAMTMATRIVVLNEGRIQQVGTPIELYREPKNLFVAKFIGTPQINLIDGEIKNNIFSDGKNTKIDLKNTRYKNIQNKEKVVLAFRPETLKIVEEKDKQIMGTFHISEFLGDYKLAYFEYENINNENNILIAKIDSDININKNEKLFFQTNLDLIRFFDKVTGKAILEDGSCE